MNGRPVIILGAGEHSGVLIDTLRTAERHVLFLTDVCTERHGSHVLGVAVKGNDELILSYSPDEIELVNGVGSIDVPRQRARVFGEWTSRGYRFANVVHPAATLGSEIRLGQGVLILAGAVLQYGSDVDDNVLVNTGAQIDHTCQVGKHSQIAPAATLCGNVRIGSLCHIGAGATVIQGIEIGDESVVGAGSVVIRDLPRGSRCAGVPACSIRRTRDDINEVRSTKED